MTRPTIGVTGPDRGGRAAWSFSAWAIRRAGGRPRRIRPAHPLPLKALDGLVIGGGANVGPLEALDADGPPSADAPDDPARDRLEHSLVAAARASGVPLLGICRGAQLINLALGGTLARDITPFYEGRRPPRSVFPAKNVVVDSDSRLATILRRRVCRVNALHGQAVDAVAPGLRVCARETTGVVQAIEGTGGGWLVGVQWHPEYLPQSSVHHRLFRALVWRAKRDSDANGAYPSG